MSICSKKLEQDISTFKNRMLNADRFLKVEQRYMDIRELMPEIVREFIVNIVAHERSETWKKKNYTQQNSKATGYRNILWQILKWKTSLSSRVELFCSFLGLHANVPTSSHGLPKPLFPAV